MTHDTGEVEEFSKKWHELGIPNGCLPQMQAFIHQELQKAREEEREDTREILRCISRMVEINATNLENYILGQMPVVDSELDQAVSK